MVAKAQEATYSRRFTMPLSRPIQYNAAANDTTYVNAAGVFLRRWSKKENAWTWLLLKNRKREDWGLPKGHQEPGETFCECAIRECAEETGIALFTLEDQPHELRYQIPSGKHKRVIYFPAITSQETVELSKEHNDYGWFTKQQATKKLSGNSTGKLFAKHLAQL